MQNKDLNNFAKRSLFYTAKAYTNQMKKNEDYNSLFTKDDGLFFIKKNDKRKF